MKTVLIIVLVAISMATVAYAQTGTGAPKPESVVVDKRNWIQAEYNKWAFQNSNQILLTATVSRGNGAPSPLEYSLRALDRVEFERVDVDGKTKTVTFAEYLAKTETDAIVVLHNGKIVFERYANGMAPGRLHTNMSVTKSINGTLMAMMIQEGSLDPDKLVSHYLPEFKGTDVGKTTVRHIADMTAGMGFSEAYADPNADVWVYGYANTMAKAPEDYAGPKNVHEYVLSMKAEDKPGQHFNYVTPMSEVMGELIRGVAGKQVAEVLSERIWSKIGAEHNALLWVDNSNRALAGSGLLSTVRDNARFGQMLLQRGTYNNHQILDPSVADGFSEGADPIAFEKWAKEAAPNIMVGWSYRDQWWVTHNEHGAYTAIGIFGHLLYIDPKANMVVAKQGSTEIPETDYVNNNNWVAMHALAKYLLDE